MFDTNPNLIQDGRSGRHLTRRSAAPLILFHDGGGTIYSYYLLDYLGRPLYGISNPHFKTGVPWTGGLYEMASAYAVFVAAAVPSGPVILGGWSLGGLLALQTARVLSKFHKDHYVAGLVLIDSACPLPPLGGWGERVAQLVERDIEWPATTKPETKVAIQQCFREAYRMVREWKPPTEWQEDLESGTNICLATNAASRRDDTRRSCAAEPPPAVLIRSQDSVPVPGDGLLFVDLHRQDRSLGWNNYRMNMFCRIIDIPGHHYDVFAFTNLEAVSKAIILACQTIEEIV